jgi:multidrug efflux pump
MVRVQPFIRAMSCCRSSTEPASASLTTSPITTMAGLAPMMFGLSVDFIGGGYTVNSPSALWWKQLATAVVFGLGIATILTLVLTPALLALRVWFWAGAYRGWAGLSALSRGKGSRAARDLALEKAARKLRGPVIQWEEEPAQTSQQTPEQAPQATAPKAALPTAAE